MDSIGFIGLGRMGRPMAANLVAAGFTVRTWNRTPGKAPPRAGECRSPREVAEQCAIVATMLADDAALEQVTLGDGGLLARLRRGGTMFGSTVFTGYGARVAATEFEPAGFAMPLALKDVTLALQAGHELRAPLPMASLLRDRLLAALARGRDGWDWSGLTSVAREEAGLPPRRT